MLLKYAQAQKRIKAAGIGKPQRTAGGMVKLTSGLVTVVPKIHRKVIKVASKRPAALHRTPAAIKREQIPVDPCDNSNDSGLGFDHHLDYHTSLATHPTLRFSDKEAAWQPEESPELKRRRLEIKLESDDANDNFTFPETVRQPAPRTICVPVRGRGRVVLPVAPLTLTSQLSSSSHNGLAQLLIVCQPEQQHRARYQTEGSRGAVKDRTGNGFPVVKLVGYDQPATLQVFIGTDQGRVAPHMFYQACRVSGKNSTPCIEKKIDGTIVIEVDIEPSKDMVVTCDCVGILKERNVDVEHRFPEEGSGRSKKKSTRCRMVFRTTITNQDGSQETLQVTSQPIVCTQPPGVPEICKKSLSSCSVRGGHELFILGKNFLKDTRVVFQEGDTASPSWSQSVQPDKEFLQQSHLVCVVPAYQTTDITEPVSVRLVVESSGKASEPHNFLYLPDNLRPADTSVLTPDGNIVNNSIIAQGGSTGVFPSHHPAPAPLIMPSEPTAPYLATQTSPGTEEKVHPVMMWEKPAEVMMPPPPPMLPITVRRSSVQMIVPDSLAPAELKREIPEPVMEPPKPMADISDLSSTQSPSMDTFRRFVSNSSLPSINVGNYFSNIEGNSVYPNKVMKSQVHEIPRIMIPSPTAANKAVFSGDSSNLLTTVEPVIVNQSGIPFDGRNACVNSSPAQSAQENLSVIVSSSMSQKKPDPLLTQDVQQQKHIAESPSVEMNLLMSSAMNKRASSATERLDAFVNSAAESHISPTPTSPIAINSVIAENSVMNPISEMVGSCSSEINKLKESNMPPMMQVSSLPISPHTSPHHGTDINDGSLCSLLNTSVQASPPSSSNQAQPVTGLHVSLDHHLNNQSVSGVQANINNLMQSSQVSTNQGQSFPDLGQQLPPQAVASQINHASITGLMQSPPSVSTSQVQALSNLQTSLEQQLSPRTVNSTQINHHSINNLIQSPPQASSQVQCLPSIQVSLEQQLPSQTMSSSHINHTDLNNVMPSPPQGSSIKVRALPDLQVSLERHLSSQTVNSTQVIHSESVQPSDLSLNTMGSAVQTSTQTSANEVQTLSNLQALEHHLSSQVICSAQSNHESLSAGTVALNSLNSTVSTSPGIQATVSQAQVLSELQASFERHITSQVMGSPPPMLESVAASTTSQAVETSQAMVSQSAALSNLQMSMSLGHMTSQLLTSSQSSHEHGTHSMNDSVQPPRVQVGVSQVKMLSNLQSSLEQHLTSQVISTNQPSSETMMPLERLSNSVHTSPQQSSNQTLTGLQASVDHLSSQVLNSAQSNHNGALSTNSLTINSAQTLDLSNPMTLINQPINISNTSTSSSPVMLSSPTSRHSPASELTSPGISLSSTPTMALSPTMSLSPAHLAIHNSQPLEINSSHNLTMSTPQTLLATDLSMSSPSTNLQMQNCQGATLQANSIGQFDQVASNVSHSLPVQVAAMNQYEQCQEMKNTNKECERKDPPTYMIPSEAVIVQPQRNFEMKRQSPAQTVKKCEEGMPLPHELTQMSEHDLISYINPSCFDTV